MMIRDIVTTFGRGAASGVPTESPTLAGAGLGALIGTLGGLTHVLARPLTGEGRASGKEIVAHGLIGATVGSIIGAISGRAASTIQKEEDRG